MRVTVCKYREKNNFHEHICRLSNTIHPLATTTHIPSICKVHSMSFSKISYHCSISSKSRDSSSKISSDEDEDTQVQFVDCSCSGIVSLTQENRKLKMHIIYPPTYKGEIRTGKLNRHIHPKEGMEGTQWSLVYCNSEIHPATLCQDPILWGTLQIFY